MPPHRVVSRDRSRAEGGIPWSGPRVSGPDEAQGGGRSPGESVLGEAQTAGVGPDLLDGLGRFGVLGHDGQEPLGDDLDEDAFRLGGEEVAVEDGPVGPDLSAFSFEEPGLEAEGGPQGASACGT